MLLKKKKAVLLANLKKRNLEDMLDNTSVDKYWTKNISAVMEKKKKKLKINCQESARKYKNLVPSLKHAILWKCNISDMEEQIKKDE